MTIRRASFASFFSLASLCLLTACPDGGGSGDTRLLSALTRAEMNAVCSVRVQAQGDDLIRGYSHIYCISSQLEREEDTCEQAELDSCVTAALADAQAEGVTVDCDLDGDNVSHVNSCTTVTVEKWEGCLDALADQLASFEEATCANFEELESRLEQAPEACAEIHAACPGLAEISFPRVIDFDERQE